jgi:sarcosine oxidase
MYDVIVAGVGGMGSAAVYHLARRGAKVLGLEQFEIPHELGSSHGVTRIIRLAYAEHPDYVPLVRRAYELWRELEIEAGERLLIITGGFDIGEAQSAIVRGSLDSCATRRRYANDFLVINFRNRWSRCISVMPGFFCLNVASLRT